MTSQQKTVAVQSATQSAFAKFKGSELPKNQQNALKGGNNENSVITDDLVTTTPKP